MRIDPRITLVTLGVADVGASRAFYRRLGWKESSASQDSTAFFQLGAIVLSLYGADALAEDAHLPPKVPGFGGITLAINVRDKADVAAYLAEAERCGAAILKPAQDVFWGGHSGYFADPDGYPWEVAWNPFFPMDDSGTVRLPE